MKKIFLVLAAAALSAATVAAQDINEATELYNNGATQLQMGDNAAALDAFKSALSMAELLGDEGLELATNCKDIIPKLVISVAKDQIKEGDYANAVTSLNDAIAIAKEYGNAEVEADATDLIPQVYMQQGNTALKAKDMATAVAAYTQVTTFDPENGAAYLRLGQCLAATGKDAEAEAAYLKAADFGQATNAKKQLSNMYVKKAQAALKAGKSQDAIDAAVKSNEYLENANACKLAASAAQKLGKNDECIAFYEKYLEVAPNAKDAGGINFTIGALYQQAGNKEKAKEYYQKVTTDPTYGAQAQQLLNSL